MELIKADASQEYILGFKNGLDTPFFINGVSGSTMISKPGRGDMIIRESIILIPNGSVIYIRPQGYNRADLFLITDPEEATEKIYEFREERQNEY